MNKKNYIVIGGLVLLLTIVIIIFITNGHKENWKNQILSAENYEISMTDCNNKEVNFPKETVEELFNKFSNLSDNGPWMGNNNKCYSTVTITFENNNIIQNREILLIDDNSLVLNLNEGNRYYTNASEVNNYLNNLFINNQ